MKKPKIFRRYEIERDENGMPRKLYWLGDVEIPPKPKAEEIDQQRLQEWERIYGKRSD